MYGVLKFPPLRHKNWQYQPLGKAGAIVDEEEQPSLRELKSARNWSLLRVMLSALLIIVLLFNWSFWQSRPSLCTNPSRRREWRTLQLSEQQEYIRAVLCLSEKPSLFEPGSSRYDDFSYTHLHEGTISHDAAPFLPWHRYFIHLFEKALTEECGYRGSLTYWDWALDAVDIVASPIWRSDTGFGGNGSDPSFGPEFYNGYCVMDGPFANATRYWESKWNGHNFDVIPNPHCLSRGFITGKKKNALEKKVMPQAIKEILEQSTYGEFVRRLERRSHGSIPQLVRGDFFLGTAPNDPVFYLHHTQIDRLWWKWQQRDPVSHMYQYHGPRENVRTHKNETHLEVSLQDVISVGPYSDPVVVRELMDINSATLCYTYD